MKNLLKASFLFITLSLPFGLTAANEPSSEYFSSNSNVIELSRCSVTVPGFSARGNCRAVMRAYERFIELQNAQRSS